MKVLILLLTATLAVGCIGLNKPEEVQACLAAHSCSDNPTQQPGPDVNQDTAQPSPDLLSGDKPSSKADVGPDSPNLDAVADQSDPGHDTKDATGTDSKETGSSSDGDAALPLPDCGPDLEKDIGNQDAGADLRPDLGPDLRPGVGPDLGPDTSPDTSTLGSGLLVYYKCEGATGTTLPDSSGNGNNGTLMGGTSGYTFSSGKVGKALALAKAGLGYVSVPPTVFANATNLTIATWVNVTTSQNWQRVFDVGVNAKLTSNTAAGTKYMNFVPKTDGTNLAFAISKDGYGSEQTLTSTALAVGTWKHVAVVLSSGQGVLYVDGAESSPSSTVLLRPTDLGAIDYAFLGKSQFTNDPYFDGQIDEFRVYGRALSAAEILALYQFAGP